MLSFVCVLISCILVGGDGMVLPSDENAVVCDDYSEWVPPDP